ncbi:copper resistance system multicopper oxidase, partial [Methylomonas rivi]
MEKFKFLIASAVVFAGIAAGWQPAYADTYRLAINEKAIDLIGQPQRAVLADGSLPAPTLHWREGEQVIMQVTNNMRQETSIHWHGIVLPYGMDGVPGISFDGIAPGKTFTYRFPIKQSGTYWYHGHSGMQEQQGLFGAIVIDPVHDHQPVDRDYVVMLSDWPEADPHRTLARLKKQSDYYNFQKRTVGDFFADARRLGFGAAIADRLAWGEMRMEPTDIADVTGATYHFLIDGQTPDMRKTYLFRPGEKIKLRFINASAMTHFDVRIPGLKMQVIAADGQPVAPVAVEEFRIAVAETYDVLVEPQTEQAYGIFAEAMDRSGYAHASLTPRDDLIAEVPLLRPMTLLTLAEMGGAHAGHTEHAAAEQPLGEPAD